MFLTGTTDEMIGIVSRICNYIAISHVLYEQTMNYSWPMERRALLSRDEERSTYYPFGVDFTAPPSLYLLYRIICGASKTSHCLSRQRFAKI